MAQKKSFKNNPALQFISTAAEETEEREQPVARATTEKAPEGYKPNPLYIETKSKRVQELNKWIATTQKAGATV